MKEEETDYDVITQPSMFTHDYKYVEMEAIEDALNLIERNNIAIKDLPLYEKICRLLD